LLKKTKHQKKTLRKPNQFKYAPRRANARWKKKSFCGFVCAQAEAS